MSESSADTTDGRWGARFAGLVAAGSAVATILVIGGLFLLAKDAPSTAVGNTQWVDQVPIEASAGCDAFADYWLESVGLAIDPETLEGFTNCRIAVDGSWVVVEEQTSSLNGFADINDPETRTELESERVEILEQIDLLEQSFPEELSSGLQGIYSEAPNPVIGHLREGVSIADPRKGYAEAIEVFIEDEDNQAFADYAAWATNRRVDSYAVFRAACVDDSALDYLSKPCRGMEGNLSINFVPWPWELKASYLLDEYLASSDSPDESA